MLVKRQSWVFQNKPSIISTGTVGGPFEGEGALGEDFDLIHKDIWLGQDSYEKAENMLLLDACNIAMNKIKIAADEINFFISGDLLNQIIVSSFSARTLTIPYLGIYGACSSSIEALALGSALIDKGLANKV